MVIKPNSWESPKRCRHIGAMYKGNELKNLPCMHDECPIGMWVPPKKTPTTIMHTPFTYEKGKCQIDIEELKKD
jgi:hypothetical protein